MVFSKPNKTKARTTMMVVLGAILLTACETPEEVAESHLKKGKELFEKGEYEKAILELKTSSQAGDNIADTYYYMALSDEKVNNFKSMKDNLLKAIELDPNKLEVRQKLGKVNLLFGELDKAMEQADFILRENPSNDEAKLLKASAFIRQKNNNKATAIIDSVLSTDPKNIDALSLKAAIAFEDNQLDRANSLVDTALNLDEKNLPLRLLKIKISSNKKDIDAVINEYKKLITLYPGNEKFKFNLASMYAMTDKLDLAEAQLREMVSDSQDKVQVEILLLEFLNAKFKDRVVPEFDKILNQTSKNEDVLELSKWMMSNNYIDEAIRGLRLIIDRDRKSKEGQSAQAIIAESYFINKDYDKAETAISDILAENSDNIEASLLRAKLYLLKYKVDDAIDLLNKTIWLKNDSDVAYVLLGQAYAMKNDKKQAGKYHKQALEINPANVQAFTFIYNLYTNANQMENARQLIDKAINAKPNQVLFLAKKAELDIAEKKWEDAQLTVQRIAVFSKNKSMPLYLEANILQGTGKFLDAIKLYEKILVDFPSNVNSMINLVRSYEGIGQREKAIAFLESQHHKYNDDLVILGVLSDLYIANKDYLKAEALLKKEIKNMTSNSVPLYLALAKLTVVIKKDSAAAKEVYIKGLQDNPDNEQLLMAMASLDEQTGNKQEARKIYEKIIYKYPDANTAVNNLVTLLIDSNIIEDQQKGFALSEKLKNEDNIYFQDTYAWALVKNGKVKEGLEILESLIVKEPKMPEIRYHLGVAHLNNDNKATALVELKQSISLADSQKRSFSGKDEAIKLIKKLSNR